MHVISLKVTCEKGNFSNCVFAIIFVIINGHTRTCILFKFILNDAQTKDKGEMHTAKHNYSKIVF